MVRVSIADAAERFDELVDGAAEAQERVIVVDRGSVVAVLVGPDELAELDAAKAIVDYLRREPNPLVRRE